MPKVPSLHPTLQGWLRDGPLAAYVPAFLGGVGVGKTHLSIALAHQACPTAMARR